MAIADFRAEPPGPRSSPLSLGEFVFTSPLPIEDAPGAGPFIGENGLGSAPPQALEMEIRWDVVALAVIFRLELHDNVFIELLDAGGAVLTWKNIHPVTPRTWQTEVLFAPGAARAKLRGGGGDAKVSMVITST